MSVPCPICAGGPHTTPSAAVADVLQALEHIYTLVGAQLVVDRIQNGPGLAIRNAVADLERENDRLARIVQECVQELVAHDLTLDSKVSEG